MSEMALTAEHLIVIGRGKMIADAGVDEFVRRSSSGYVRVRTPQSDVLTRLLEQQGASVEVEDDGALAVTGADTVAVGELAAHNGVTIHELVAQSASLEEAFMELTHDSIEYGPRDDQGKVA
jgi:ABC-2 type transport system ATP-binding protein